jgi:hypothetical protein
MSSVSLSWSTAEVKDSKLTVTLEGEIPRGWRKSFEATVRLLGHGDWGEIQVKKDKVQVSDVQEGSEDKLRHHLEGIVAQANADHERDEPAPAEEDAEQGPDAEMTDHFRSFAPEGDEEEGDA